LFIRDTTVDAGAGEWQIGASGSTTHRSPTRPMYRITRGSQIQHAPAYPSPAFRFPDGVPIPIYLEGVDTNHSAPGDRAESEASSDVSPPPMGQ
jgi:hypothetical protein